MELRSLKQVQACEDQLCGKHNMTSIVGKGVLMMLK